MDELINHIKYMNGLFCELLYLEGRIKSLQEARDEADLHLEQLRSAQRDACENGHKWPGPPREHLEAAKVAYRDAKLDLEEALRTQARYMADLGEAREKFEEMKRDYKRAQRNKPLTGRPFAALLG